VTLCADCTARCGRKRIAAQVLDLEWSGLADVPLALCGQASRAGRGALVMCATS